MRLVYPTPPHLSLVNGGAVSMRALLSGVGPQGIQGPAWSDPDALTVGQETIPRIRVTNNAAGGFNTGIMGLTYFTARKSETITQLKTITGTTAAAATPTLCRMGLYLISGNALTLVAACANDTTLFAAASTAYTRSIVSPASYAVVAGQRYATGLLQVSAAACATFCGDPYVLLPISEMSSTAPVLTGFLPGQADLPALFYQSSVGSANRRAYMVLLP